MSNRYNTRRRGKGRVCLFLLWGFCLAAVLAGCGLAGGERQITKMDERYLAAESAAPDQTEQETPSPADSVSPAPGGKQDGSVPEDGKEPGKQKKNSADRKGSGDGQSSSEDNGGEGKKPQDTSGDSEDPGKKSTSSHKNAVKKDTEKKKPSDKTNKEKNDSAKKKDAVGPVGKDTGESAGDHQDAKENKDTLSCYISIDCKKILPYLSQVKESKREYVPGDGVILQKTRVQAEPGSSVYDVLYQVCTERNIHLEASFTPLYRTYYVEGIHQLYEFDCGDQSGWNYLVNGVQPGMGCSKYQVKEGDVISWRFTRDRGRDL